MTTAWITLSLFYIASSILPAWNAEYWWVRGFDFPRLQLFTVGLICLIGAFFLDISGKSLYLLLILLFSALGLDLYLTDEQVPAIFAEIVLPKRPRVRVFALHPRPPRPQEGHSDKRDAELLQVASIVEKKDMPTIVMGDLNDVAWSHTSRLFQRISGLLDPRRGRGTYNTYPVDYPFFRYPLDHIFHSNHFYFADLKVLADIGSDHFPIYAKFDLVGTSTPEQEEVTQEEGDKEEAENLKSRVRENQ